MEAAALGHDHDLDHYQQQLVWYFRLEILLFG
jgi:hypothetical protein